MTRTGKKILVVEDDTELRETIAELLKSVGYDPVSMPDGLYAVRFLENEIPDLIISDIMMPNVDGYQLLEYIQKMASLSNIPFIFISGRADYSDIREGMIKGADDYIKKPFRALELIQSIDTQLKKKEKLDNKFEQICGNISAYIPHELTTPIVAILGYPDLIIENIKSLSEDEIVFMLSQIKFSGQRLHKTIGKFIKYADIQCRSIRSNINGSGAAGNSHVLAAINLARERISETSDRLADLILEVTDAELSVEYEDLEFLVEELLTNAIKFSKKGSKIILKGKPDSEMYKLEVTDHGRGMTQEQIREIVPFIQHERMIYEQQGSGLGLVTVKKIAEYYGGMLKISSLTGNYTTLDILLPLPAVNPK
jgi:two-component system, sensor histidine kinase and response regulator